MTAFPPGPGPAYDAIVVGARCGGAPTAMLLARAGYRVLMLDRARFPRDTLSTLYIHQPGTALLDRWGLLDRVAATGCPPITTAMHRMGGVTVEGAPSPVGGVHAAYAPRRYLLDALLAEAAVDAGVEFRDDCRVTDVLVEDGRAVGVRWRTASGGGTDRAALVIGADGMRSVVAAAVQAEPVREHPPLTCVYYGYWEGVPVTRFEAYAVRGRWVGCLPTNDGRTLIAVYFPQAEYPAVRQVLPAAYLDGLAAAAPELHERARAGTRIGPLYGSGTQRNFFRRAAGPGWALVGDAGHHKDSITADGITAAFQQAAHLAARIGADLRDPARLEAASERYTADRDRMLATRYTDTLALARLRADRIEARIAGAVHDPAWVQAFFDRAAGSGPDLVPVPDIRSQEVPA
ncbi:NAD(P)/FAD-dependent oxidoreductase [Yinghuangia seranimata]|uniref:NAD(P)/FAD-dependent oxidoreductase n=1 Tax=Yinghuangia seranimata TaxID=408067 RepID=UPI00248B9C2E|nr:FAD-dependent monooxygenase [Yinghuangia seranimata]MDI2125659.1 FAD-dependent monooxygenase [Yinghuangia seranimata]